jgi:DnaK suppressor protein
LKSAKKRKTRETGFAYLVHPKTFYKTRLDEPMDIQKLDFFRNLLLEQRQQAVADMRADHDTALEQSDGVADSGEVSQLDVNRSTALDLGGRAQSLIEEIDEALGRIEDGTYGQCERCGKPIDEERLKAMPTARYDAQCQAAIEAAQGIEEMPTL